MEERRKVEENKKSRRIWERGKRQGKEMIEGRGGWEERGEAVRGGRVGGEKGRREVEEEEKERKGKQKEGREEEKRMREEKGKRALANLPQAGLCVDVQSTLLPTLRRTWPVTSSP